MKDFSHKSLYEEYNAELRAAKEEKERMEKEIKEFLEKKETTFNPVLDKMIREMYLTTPVHISVCPSQPLPGQIVIPKKGPHSGLARCMCSESCTKEVPQPAYYTFGDAPGDDRWSSIGNMVEEQIRAVHEAFIEEHPGHKGLTFKAEVAKQD